MKQRESETVDDFVVRSRVAADRCGFLNDTDKEIKRRIIEGCISKSLRKHILENDGVLLKDILIRARAAEAAANQSASIEKAAKKEPNFKNEPISAVGQRFKKDQMPRKTTTSNACASRAGGQTKCFACGYEVMNPSCTPKSVLPKAKNAELARLQGILATQNIVRRTKRLLVKSVRNTWPKRLKRQEDENDKYIFAFNCNSPDRPRTPVSISQNVFNMLVDSQSPTQLVGRGHL